jgi:hypothetical protein
VLCAAKTIKHYKFSLSLCTFLTCTFVFVSQGKNMFKKSLSGKEYSSDVAGDGPRVSTRNNFEQVKKKILATKFM